MKKTYLLLIALFVAGSAFAGNRSDDRLQRGADRNEAPTIKKDHMDKKMMKKADKSSNAWYRGSSVENKFRYR